MGKSKKQTGITPTIVSNQTITSVRLPNWLVNAANDIVKKRDFLSFSEFIRYAVRKEVDYQLSIIYIPQINKKD